MDKDNQHITIICLLSSSLEKSCCQTSHQIIQIGQGIQKLSTISNLSFTSRSFEKAALLQLSTYFEDQNLLPTNQCASCKHHSPETAVLNICDEILQNVEHKEEKAMVCLKLSAAFETVNQTI